MCEDRLCSHMIDHGLLSNIVRTPRKFSRHIFPPMGKNINLEPIYFLVLMSTPGIHPWSTLDLFPNITRISCKFPRHIFSPNGEKTWTGTNLLLALMSTTCVHTWSTLALLVFSNIMRTSCKFSRHLFCPDGKKTWTGTNSLSRSNVDYMCSHMFDHSLILQYHENIL